MKKSLKNIIDPSDKNITIDVLEEWLNSFSKNFKVTIKEYDEYYRIKVLYVPDDEDLVCEQCETFEDLLEEIYTVFFALKMTRDTKGILWD